MCSLSANELDYQCADHVAQLVRMSATLRRVSVAKNPLHDAGATALVAALAKNATLTEIRSETESHAWIIAPVVHFGCAFGSLAGCCISCESVVPLAECLTRRNHTLTAIECVCFCFLFLIYNSRMC